MKIPIRSFLLAGLLLAGLLTLGARSALPEVAARKTVLVLSPFQLDLSTNLIAAQAMREEFGKVTDLSLDVYYEYLDLNRFPDPAHQGKIFDLLTAKYQTKQVDLVIVGSEAMLKLWLEQRAEILPDTPVVFFDVFTEHLDALALPANVTGVSGVEDCERSVRWAMDAIPAVNEIVLVGGVGKIEQGFFDHIQKLQEDLNGQVKFIDLSGLPLAELKQRVAALPSTSLVFYHPMFEDADGNKYRPLDVLRELTAVSSVPVIGGYDQFIGTGILGGYMYSIDQQARDAAQIGLRVLRGEAVSSITIVQNDSDRFIFDHPALQRFNIPLALLPPESIVKNRQYSFWELYRLEIIAAGTGIVILLFLVVYLLGLTRQLNRTRLALADLNANLETQVQERTELLHRTNTQLQDEVTEREKAEQQLRESERRLTTLMGNLPGMAYRCRNDLDWTMEFVSEGCLDLTGYGAVELIENRVIAYRRVIHSKDQARILENVQTAVRAGTAYDQVYRIVTAAGVEKWVMERGRGVFTEQGELLALEGFISDITQQKYTEQTLHHAHAESEVRVYERTMELTQANEALRQYQVNFEAVVKNAHDGILIANAAGETVFANSKFAEIAGYPLAEMTQTTMRDLAHPDEYPMLAERLRRRVAGEAVPNTYETAIRHKGGGKVPIEITASNVLWQGQPADLVIIRDIAGRKQSEEMTAVRLRLMEFADTHSLEELLQYTLDEVGGLVDSPLGFFHFVEADQITLSLQAWSTRTEKEFCAAAGKGLHYSIDQAGVWVDAVHQKQPVIHNNYASLSHKKGLPEGHAVLTRELVVPILVNGRVVAILGVGNKPVEYTDQDVEIVAHLADVAWEITSRKKIEQELLQYRDHLEQVVQSRTGELVTANERLAQEAQERKINLAKYTTLFELFPLGITIAGTDGRILESNREAERMLGVSRQEQEQRIVGGSEWSIIRPDGTPMPAEEFASVRALQEQCRIENIEMGIVKGDQPITWINVTAAPIPAEGLGVAVVYSDITERKRTEEKLQQSEEKFRSLLDSQESNIQVIDYDGIHHYVNQVGALTITGSGSAQNIIGKRLHDLFPVKTADWQLEQIRRVITTGQGMSGDFQNDDNNQTTWWHLNLQPIRNASGQTAQVMVNSLDITERKRAETALKDSELFVSGVLNSLTAQIAVLDERGVIVSVNESWRKFAAANDCPDPASYVGTNYLTVCEKAVHAGDQSAEGMLQGMRAVLAGSEAQFMDEYPCDAPGVPRWFTVTVLPQSQPRSGLIVVHQDITERKRAEQALRESTSSFHAVLQSTADGILAVDSESRVLFMNGRFVELWRLPAEIKNSRDDAALLQYVLDQLSDPQQFLENVHDLYRSGKENFDILNFKDGRVFERLSHPLIRDEKNSGRVWSFRDITERRQMEEQLRENERRTATILRLSPIVIGVSTAAEGRYTDVNEAFEHVLGYSQAETLGHTSHELNLWVGEDTRANILREIQAHGRVENLEIQIRRKSGEVFPAQIFIVPITLHDTPCLLTMMMDITDRKQAEEKLRETHDALQTIIHSSPLAILALDPEDHVTMWNPAAEAMFGWSDKQVLGQVNPTVPENKAKEYNALRLATLNGMAFSNLDTLRMKKDGEQFPVSVSVAPLRGQNSEVIGRLHIIADSTERKKLQEDLRQQATTDELTKVSNRRHFIELANSEIKRALRLRRPPSVALIDIDHFKQINDTYGHAVGDQALIRFAKLCQMYIREIDVFARFGGDEFILLLPETNQEQAYEVLERIRLALTAQPLDLNGRQVALTISAGIASLSGDQDALDVLISQADQALYRAKETGRNKVARYDKLYE